MLAGVHSQMFSNITLTELYSNPVGVTLGNPMFAGALYLMVLGAIGTILYSFAKQMYYKFIKLFWVSLVLDGRDPIFHSVQVWLSTIEEAKHSRSLEVFSQKQRGNRGITRIGFAAQMETQPQVLFMPAQGNLFIRYQNQFIWVRRTSTFNSATQSSQESITLSSLGRSTDQLKEIIHESMTLSKNLDRNQTVVFSLVREIWERTVTKPQRPWSSVKLNDNIAEDLLQDVERFLEHREIYHQRGIPHRRGYLLYGPPGTGKTSFIAALAGKLNYSISTMSLSNSSLTDEGLIQALSFLPSETILLLEDIDAIFTEDHSSTKSTSDEQDQPSSGSCRGMKTKKLSFSGLLNALDGVSTAEGRLLFMTTNHKEKLDPALIRPGRVDRDVLIDYASKQTVMDMFEHFYSVGSSDDRKIKQLSKQLEELLHSVSWSGVPMARIQNHFLIYMNNPHKAICPEIFLPLLSQ